VTSRQKTIAMEYLDNEVAKRRRHAGRETSDDESVVAEVASMRETADALAEVWKLLLHYTTTDARAATGEAR
jgi:hypothetical protein